MSELEGKTAIITGATSGIGRAVAELFAREGANILANGRDQRGSEIVETINKRGGKATFVQGDIRSKQTNERLVEAAMDTYGRLDIVIPNAGILGLGSVTEVDTSTWHQTIETNLHGVFYLLQNAIPKLQKNKKGGAIVVTGSIAAHKGFPNHAAYCASKGAVEALVRQVAVDYGPQIRINLIQPGPVDTRIYNESAIAFPNPDTILDEVPNSLPMKRIGSPKEIAQTALFLAGDRSAWITGSVITADGGASAAG